MKILRALPADSAQLTEIALASKRQWRYPERWIELWRPLLTITPEYITSHEVFVLRNDDDNLIGFYALHADDDRLQLDHLWLEPNAIGRGYGRALFRHAIQRARERGAQALEIEADPNAQGFYRRMGAIEIGEHLTEVDGQARVLPVLRFDLT